MAQQAKLPEPPRRGAKILLTAVFVLAAVFAVAWVHGHRKRPATPPPAPVATGPAVAPMPAPPPPPPPGPPLEMEPRNEKPLPLPKAIPGATTDATLLARVREAVARDPGSALLFADKHAQSYPKSRSAEERDGLRVEALVRLGRIGDARVALAAFEKRHPKSARSAALATLIEKTIAARGAPGAGKP